MSESMPAGSTWSGSSASGASFADSAFSNAVSRNAPRLPAPVMPTLASRFGLHPANTYSVAHHRDVAAAVQIALDGALDGRIANVTDDADVTVYDMCRLAGSPIEGSAEPLANPWAGRMDSSFLRSLGFRPSVPTIWQAAADGIL